MLVKEGSLSCVFSVVGAVLVDLSFSTDSLRELGKVHDASRTGRVSHMITRIWAGLCNNCTMQQASNHGAPSASDTLLKVLMLTCCCCLCRCLCICYAICSWRKYYTWCCSMPQTSARHLTSAAYWKSAHPAGGQCSSHMHTATSAFTGFCCVTSSGG